MSKSSIPWNQFGKLDSASALEEYMKREYEHSDYFHYTSLNTIDLILKNKEFWVSPVMRLNDEKDRTVFGDDSDLYFSLCFSSGINENLPLWYLYSGIDGKGGSIRFTKSAIRKLINNSRYYLSTSDNNIIMELTENECQKKFEDVIYYSEKKGTSYVDLKYNTMTNHNNITVSDFKSYQDNHVGFYKSLIWFYEKETRLVIKLKGEAKDYVRKNTLKDNYYVIKLDFSESINVSKNMKIKLAPEIKEIDEIIMSHEEINQFLKDSSRLDTSDYAGTIKMDLKSRMCKECKEFDEHRSKE